MGRRKRDWRPPFWEYLQDCFGRDDEDARTDCPCPPACKRLCAAIHLTKARSPRHESIPNWDRPFTPIPNTLIGSWGLPRDKEPSDSAKLTYLFLLRWTNKGFRWVYASTPKLAAGRGISERTFRKHCKALERLGLLRRVPQRYIASDRRSNRHLFLLPDLPKGFSVEWTNKDKTATCRPEPGERRPPAVGSDDEAPKRRTKRARSSKGRRDP